MLELFTTIRDTTKEIVPQGAGQHQLIRMGSYSALDSIMTNSQQYEVMFVGRVRVSEILEMSLIRLMRSITGN